MNKIGKILTIIFIVVFSIFCVAYLDFFIAKSRNTTPKLAIKKEINENLVVYNALLYKVWYCKTNDTITLGDYKDVDAVCPNKYTYENGFYKNSLGLSISEKDMTLISEIYTSEMIENMSSKSELEDAVYVAVNYGKTLYKKLKEYNSYVKSPDDNYIVVFKNYKQNEKGKYEWVYDEDVKYCLNSKKEVALYEDTECGEYNKIKLDDKWCKLYTNSTLVYKDNIGTLCK